VYAAKGIQLPQGNPSVSGDFKKIGEEELFDILSNVPSKIRSGQIESAADRVKFFWW